MTRLSVLLPVSNPDPNYLTQAVESVLRQTMGDFELLVLEEESRRGAVDILERFDDQRIRYLCAPNQGLPAALNYGISQAAAPVVARMDADDVCTPDRFASQLSMFERDPRLTVSGSQLTVIGENGQTIGWRRYPLTHDEIARGFLRYNCLAHPTVMFRKANVEEAGGYAPGRGEDYDLWCRLLLRGARFANHPEPLVRYRIHPDALKHYRVRDQIRVTIAVKKRYFGWGLGLRGHLRLAGEYLLLLLPSGLVLTIFQRMQYRRPRAVDA